MSDHRPWVILAPEYPPAAGGVAGYTRQLADGLTGRGRHVEVWSPAPAHATLGGASVHQLLHGYDAEARRSIRASLRAQQNPIVLLQYVPLALGGPSFVGWLTRTNVELWVMFHEVAYSLARRQSLRHRVLGVGTQLLARSLVRRADHVLVSIPAWEPVLDRLGQRRSRAVWLPIPSNISPEENGPGRDDLLASHGLNPARPVVGTFSAFGAQMAEFQRRTALCIVRGDPNVQVLLIGRESSAFLERLAAEAPDIASRVRATGPVSLPSVAHTIATTDVLVFPYNEGVSTRRTSLMAALALGKAIVTTRGWATESVWSREGCVELCPSEPAALAERTLALLGDAERRRVLGARARRVYEERFSMEHVLDTLLRIDSGPMARA